MIEVELKAVVPNLRTLRRRLEGAGAHLVFDGELKDRRYDTADASLRAHDVVLRLRVYRRNGATRAQLDWKGPTSSTGRYKRREELTSDLADPRATHAILERLGYRVTMAIDRRIWQYQVAGAMVRLERFPRMDDLVEIEGSPRAIERAIVATGLPRAGFTAEQLRDFVARYEARTKRRAALAKVPTERPTRAGAAHG